MNEDFLNIINKTDIICLQETRKEVKFRDYRCFNLTRKGTKGGGVAIAVSRSISAGISKVTSLSSVDTIAIKLSKHFFKTNKDIIIINTYIPPCNSSYYKRLEYDPFEALSNEISQLESHSDIIVCGDFNSRTKTTYEGSIVQLDIPGNDAPDNSTNVCLPDRNNMDTRGNSHSDSFIDLATVHNLAIVNGRTQGDLFGEFTCITYQGASTVDYILTPHHLLGDITEFRVGNLNCYSDHRPLKLSLTAPEPHTRQSITFNFEQTPLPFKWKPDSEKTFCDAQSESDIMHQISDLQNTPITGPHDVYSLSENVNSLFMTISDKSLQKAKNPPP